MKKLVYLGLGSNVGDRRAHLEAAIGRLAELGRITAQSSFYETEPVGPPQPRYLNAVVRIGTLLSPRVTLQRLQAIEEQMGRIRRERWGSREIDLDLLLYGDRLVEETGLRIPHPLLEGRAFALVPLAEIAPDSVHPVLGLTVRELRDRLPPDQLRGVLVYRPIREPLPEPEGEEKSSPAQSVLDPAR